MDIFQIYPADTAEHIFHDYFFCGPQTKSSFMQYLMTFHGGPAFIPHKVHIFVLENFTCLTENGIFFKCFFINNTIPIMIPICMRVFEYIAYTAIMIRWTHKLYK